MKLLGTLLVGLAIAREARADAKEEAQVHVDTAKTLHAEGKLAEALAELKEAYVLDPRPELLFAIGQIHVGLGQCAEAIVYYERFLGTRPEPDTRAVTEEAIRTCKEQPDSFVKPEPPPPPPPDPTPAPRPPPPPPPRPPWYSDWIADGLIVGGVASGVAAGLFYRSARADRDRADEVSSFQQYADLIDESKGKRTTAIVLGVAGVGLVAGGVIKWMLRESTIRKEQARYGLAPARGGGLVTRTWRF